MYERITGENPYEAPMRIYPAVHYTMGGLWVDYDLQSTIPGLFVIGEANFSDHGANRLGASALMQGLADGYFVLPTTHRRLPGGRAVRRGRRGRRRRGRGRGRRPGSSGCSPSTATAPPTPSTASSASSCGTTAAWSAPRSRCARRWSGSPSCARSSGRTSRSPATDEELNQALEKAGRVADFFDLAELMCLDALHPHGVVRRPLPRRVAGRRRRGPARRRALRARRRPGSTAPEGEPVLHKEPLEYDYVKMSQRSYK